ncbi:alpha/beta hydrolase [Nocardia sp. NPDC051463]|uniref:esterase/lipase family protein n=1 Tax=Nocardia sp. NPDC051463 TaxID=3154845 RepID=UPI00343DD6C2
MLARIVRLAVVMVCAAVGSVAGHAAATPAVGRNPVLVIGGYDADQEKLESLRSWLDARGYAAYSMVLRGNPTGTAAIADSARAVSDKVAEIRRETGAVHVDLAGHSMGGLAQRHYTKFLGGSDQVGTYVDFGTPELGEPLGWLCAVWSEGCRDMAPGSEFLTNSTLTPQCRPACPPITCSPKVPGERRTHCRGLPTGAFSRSVPDGRSATPTNLSTARYGS